MSEEVKERLDQCKKDMGRLHGLIPKTSKAFGALFSAVMMRG